MNLAQALVQALPELPTQVIAGKKFKFNPNLVVREETGEDGRPVRSVWVPDRAIMYYIEEPQWELFQLFNGERNMADVARLYEERTGAPITEKELREFAYASVDTGLWYESAQERNITLSQKLRDERLKRSKQKGKFSDLSHIFFKGWDADNFLTWVHDHFGFIYTRWFTILTLCSFVFMTGIWIDRWTEIGRDTLQYYTFTQKSAGDIAEFWVLFLVMAFFHESAHGLTAKHYGASVHDMGFQLIYLAPAFAVELTELWARVGRRERLLAIIAGLWVETMFCAGATFVWWATPSGVYVHELAYKIMLITGIMVLVVNLNPLMKLDGYYALAEIVGVPELKESSTAYLSSWVRRKIFRLPVEPEYVPARRRNLFIVYGVLSGIYSYLLLFAVSQFTFNIFRRFTPEWAFIPAGWVAWKIFRSRIKHFIGFMKTVYLHHRDRLNALRGGTRIAVAAAALLVCLLPVFRRTQSGLFVLEPVRQATLRAEVPGWVEHVYVGESSRVSAGTPIATLRNREIESQEASAEADVNLAHARLIDAQLHYAAMGPAQSEFARAQSVVQTEAVRRRELKIQSPIAGVVTSKRVRDLQGTYVAAGTVIAEVADPSAFRARLYLSESEVREVKVGAPVALKLTAMNHVWRGEVESIAASDAPIPDGLMPKSQYEGLRPPPFFVVNVVIRNPGGLSAGMTGQAKILVDRESLARMALRGAFDLVRRRLW